jgi:hypothetical protein
MAAFAKELGAGIGRVFINARMSGLGGEAEILCSTRALPVLTQLRRRPVFLTAAKSASLEYCL